MIHFLKRQIFLNINYHRKRWKFKEHIALYFSILSIHIDIKLVTHQYPCSTQKCSKSCIFFWKSKVFARWDSKG